MEEQETTVVSLLTAVTRQSWNRELDSQKKVAVKREKWKSYEEINFIIIYYIATIIKYILKWLFKPTITL